MTTTHCSITEVTRPLKRASVRPYEIDGEAVLYDLARDTVHYLNSSAWLIWNLCDGNTNAETIAELVMERFAPTTGDRMPAYDILGDTIVTLTNLAGDGLIDVASDEDQSKPMSESA